jgi:hypothetical protein
MPSSLHHFFTLNPHIFRRFQGSTCGAAAAIPTGGPRDASWKHRSATAASPCATCRRLSEHSADCRALSRSRCSGQGRATSKASGTEGRSWGYTNLPIYINPPRRWSDFWQISMMLGTDVVRISTEIYLVGGETR